MKNARKVVVTTVHRGVFFGTLVSQAKDVCVLKDARNCVHWSAKTRGFLGLAANGPDDGSRVGPAVPRLELLAVTSISDVTPEAAARWESGPWS